MLCRTAAALCCRRQVGPLGCQVTLCHADVNSQPCFHKKLTTCFSQKLLHAPSASCVTNAVSAAPGTLTCNEVWPAGGRFGRGSAAVLERAGGGCGRRAARRPHGTCPQPAAAWLPGSSSRGSEGVHAEAARSFAVAAARARTSGVRSLITTWACRRAPRHHACLYVFHWLCVHTEVRSFVQFSAGQVSEYCDVFNLVEQRLQKQCQPPAVVPLF